TPHPRPILNRAAAPVIPTLPLHDALPICRPRDGAAPWPALRATPAYCRPNCATAPGNAADDRPAAAAPAPALPTPAAGPPPDRRSEEHTSELQSREKLVCRLLLEKKNSDN